jgi:hypothetical protein
MNDFGSPSLCNRLEKNCMFLEGKENLITEIPFCLLEGDKKQGFLISFSVI